MSRPHRWDEGVSHFQRLVDGPTRELLNVDAVMEQVIRVANDDADIDFVQRAIVTARRTFEQDTLKAAGEQTWTLICDRFPCHWFELPRPPLLTVTAIDYYDAAGDLQTLTGSPAQFLIIPSGEYVPGRVLPLVGASWPSTAARPDAVTVTYTAGYTVDTIPQQYLTGMELLVGELYKQRTLSVAAAVGPAHLQLERFWKRVW